MFCFGLTNYTAKLLAKCLNADPESRTYGDMGAFAFGIRGRVFISILFLTELITCRYIKKKGLFSLGDLNFI